MAVFASIPSPVMFVAWTVAAVAGLGFVARALASRIGTGLAASPGVVGVIAMALAPLMFPVRDRPAVREPRRVLPAALRADPARRPADGLDCGLGRLRRGSERRSIAKLHPGSLGLWLLVRSFRAPEARRAVLVAVAVLAGILAISVLVFGTLPWTQYAMVVRAGSQVDLIDPRNAGPAAQLAMLLGNGGGGTGPALARTLQIPVTLIALLVTAVVAVRLADPVESLAWAAAASLVVLPVTWYHYPSALIPFAIVAYLRAGSLSAATAQRVRLTVVAAAVVAAAAIALLPLLYVAIGLAGSAERGPLRADPSRPGHRHRMGLAAPSVDRRPARSTGASPPCAIVAIVAFVVTTAAIVWSAGSTLGYDFHAYEAPRGASSTATACTTPRSTWPAASRSISIHRRSRSRSCRWRRSAARRRSGRGPGCCSSPSPPAWRSSRSAGPSAGSSSSSRHSTGRSSIR